MLRTWLRTGDTLMAQTRWTLSLALTVLTVAGLASPAAAQQEVPFRGAYTLDFTVTETDILGVFRIEYAGTGHASHLGRSITAAESLLDTRVVPFTTTGTETFTAANGDEVFTSFDGTSSPPDPNGIAYFAGSFVITGGTGRFLGATGGGEAEGTVNVVTVTSEQTFSGTISRR